jgi:hypothetical protein
MGCQCAFVRANGGSQSTITNSSTFVPERFRSLHHHRLTGGDGSPGERGAGSFGA